MTKDSQMPAGFLLSTVSTQRSRLASNAAGGETLPFSLGSMCDTQE